MIGELNLLHSSLIVNTLAAIVTLLSAVLIKILPDMTKEAENASDIGRHY